MIYNNQCSEELSKGDIVNISKDYLYLDIESGNFESEIYLNPQVLAKNIWQKIWINTGKEPEKCLYNVVELFIFKFLSDLKILNNSNHTFEYIYNLTKEKDGSKNALEAYCLIRNKIREIFRIGVDNTTIISGTIFVNEKDEANLNNAELFKDILNEFAKFEKSYGKFNKIDKNFKTRLYENFLRQGAGLKALGQYFTPRNVVKAVIEMCNVQSIRENDAICDPFCGVGGFLLELLNESDSLKSQFIPLNGVITPTVTIIGYDKGSDEKDDERTIILAKANMLIYFSDLISKYPNAISEFADKAFNKTFNLIRNNLGTFSLKIEEKFDLILTNPPYVTNGFNSIKKQLPKNTYECYGTGLEGLSIEWIIKALKPNGRAFIIVPKGMLVRTQDAKLRTYILNTCKVNGIVSLPQGTFFATSQKTYILALTKKINATETMEYNFFTYLVKEIGETRNVDRVSIECNDLVPMSRLFKQFTAVQDLQHEDKQCKLIPISRLTNDEWLIDRYWTDDEKQEIGLLDDSKRSVAIEDYFNFSEEIINEIAEFKEKINNIKCKIDKLTNTQTVNLKLDDICFFYPTKSVIKDDINKNGGSVPVYGSRKDGKPIGYIQDNLKNVSYFENVLAWNCNGSVGYVFIRDERFAVTCDHRPFSLKEEYKNKIDPKYLRYSLQITLLNNGFAWGFKPSTHRVKELSIPIPIDIHNNFDLSKQEVIAEYYDEFENHRRNIIEYLQEIQKL